MVGHTAHSFLTLHNFNYEFQNELCRFLELLLCLESRKTHCSAEKPGTVISGIIIGVSGIHPYYESIRDHLAGTISYIDTQLDDLDPPIAYGGNRYTHRQLNRENLARIDRLKESRQEAYTARIDWDDVQEGSETFYIGKFAVPERKIYSWASEFGERLYFHPTEHRADGTVRLILNISLSGEKLRNLYNHYVHASLEGQLTRAEFTDSLLFKLLQDSHSKLRDIVATIQEKQYRIIRSPKDQLLVVQGAPGSGKTSVALHRVAYLLYNYRSETFTARNILILVLQRRVEGS